jgi:hypothetical protein
MSDPVKILLLAFVIIAPAAPLIISGTWADGLRWSGMWYQLAGLGVVLWGLNERPKALGLTSLRSRLTGWLARMRDRLLRRPRPPTVRDAALHVNVSTVARAQVKATGTPEERLDRLEVQLYRLAGEMHDSIRKVEALVAEKIEGERTQREIAVSGVRYELREATLGNTTLDLIGVALFVAGTIFSSISPSF